MKGQVSPILTFKHQIFYSNCKSYRTKANRNSFEQKPEQSTLFMGLWEASYLTSYL